MKLLSIVVLSYNRPSQIERILEYFVNFKSNDIVLIVKDDASPMKNKISEIVDKYTSSIGIEVRMHNNPRNIGFDMNLIDAFNIVDTEYLMFLSDDDYLRTESLNSLASTIKVSRQSVFFTPYIDQGKVSRLAIGVYDSNRFSDVIYNSVLFSGLVFKVNSVKRLDIDINLLKNCIYSQVYLVALIVFEEKQYGVLPSGILYIGGDGENFFGLNESATNSAILSDRKKLSSNFLYQQLLLDVVKQISKKTCSSVYISFRKEYSRRLIAYFLRVRSHGILAYLSFCSVYLNSKKSPFLFPTLILFPMIFLPTFISKIIYNYGVKFLKKSG